MRKFLIVFLVVFMEVSSATFISTTTSVSVENVIQGNETLANLTIVNSGDEPAYDVFVSLILPEGLRSNDLFPGRLNPDEPYAGEFKIGIDENVTWGTYSLGVITDYKDVNGYPFSAVSSFSLIIKNPAASRVTASIPEITLADGETKGLRLSIRNFDDKPHKVEVEFILPRELEGEGEERTVVVDKDSNKEISFKISSLGALSGSNYVILATVSYEEGGLHYSSSASGVVHVVERRGFDMPSWIPIAALLILILVFILYQFRK
jgi:hypothetical protein